MSPIRDRRALLRLLLVAPVLPVSGVGRQEKTPKIGGVSVTPKGGAYHVFTGGHIQNALEAAARDPVNKTVYVHAGTYPRR